MRLILCCEALFVFSLIGCRTVETDANHILHAGESGVLTNATRPAVCAAISNHDVHRLADAVETHNDADVNRLITAGKAIEIPDNTHVRVEKESYNERCVRIQEGKYAGRLVWVPYEWIHPLPAHRTRS